MLDRFQNLPPAVRTVLFLALIGVVIGAVLLLARFANPSVPPSALQTTDPDNAVSASPSPDASEPVATPNPSGPNNLAPTDSPSDIYGKDRKFSDSQLASAGDVASKALLANCRYAADESATEWVDSQRPYYTAEDFPYSTSDHVSVLLTQKCTVRDAKPQSQTSAGELVVGLAATQETTYQQGAPIVPDSNNGRIAYSYVLGGTATMKLVDGKWYVVDLDVSQQGN